MIDEARQHLGVGPVGVNAAGVGQDKGQDVESDQVDGIVTWGDVAVATRPYMWYYYTMLLYVVVWDLA